MGSKYSKNCNVYFKPVNGLTKLQFLLGLCLNFNFIKL